MLAAQAVKLAVTAVIAGVLLTLYKTTLPAIAILHIANTDINSRHSRSMKV